MSGAISHPNDISLDQEAKILLMLQQESSTGQLNMNEIDDDLKKLKEQVEQILVQIAKHKFEQSDNSPPIDAIMYPCTHY